MILKPPFPTQVLDEADRARRAGRSTSVAWPWRAVDWSRSVGLVGHSMGGLATVLNAGDARVAAAVAVGAGKGRPTAVRLDREALP